MLRKSIIERLVEVSRDEKRKSYDAARAIPVQNIMQMR